LYSRLDAIWTDCRKVFPQQRTWARAYRLSLGLLLCMGRHTLTGALYACGHQFVDWSADYRVFSRVSWDTPQLFASVRQGVCTLLPPEDDFLAALDDTILIKSGTHIPGVAYRRDPMSPPFHTNFVRGQRYCQVSSLVPLNGWSGPARAVPIQFKEVPPVPKPKKDATLEAWKDYRLLARQQSLPSQGAALLSQLRRDLDGDPLGLGRRLICSFDGAYCNQRVLKPLPERTIAIGRIRGDAKLFALPAQQPHTGRRRQYGDQLPTPLELLRDDSVPWTLVSAFAAGKLHDFKIKTLSPVLWKKAGASKLLRLVVIAPLSYRPRKGAKLLYRQPAFLICTDPSLPLERLIQVYVWRWEIEVNHRDEKQLLGAGQAQVRNPRSAERLPTFTVASYSMLLLASLQQGARPVDSDLPPPKWRSTAPKARLSTQDLLAQLREETWRDELDWDTRSFDHFASPLPSVANSPKLRFPLASALLYCRN
jgi:hypothetical protein